MKTEILYRAIETNQIKPIEVWDKLPYTTKMLYCEQAARSGSWKDIFVKEVDFAEVEAELDKLITHT